MKKARHKRECTVRMIHLCEVHKIAYGDWGQAESPLERVIMRRALGAQGFSLVCEN